MTLIIILGVIVELTLSFNSNLLEAKSLIKSASPDSAQSCVECHEPIPVTSNVHNELECHECHTGFVNEHEDNQNPVIADCGECHGDHDIKKLNDPESKIYQGNVVSTCMECHITESEEFLQSNHRTQQLKMKINRRNNLILMMSERI